MTPRTATFLKLVFAGFFGLWLIAAPAVPGFAYDEPDRTVHRNIFGMPVYPDWLFNKPDHYEFLPLTSNSDPKTQHPAAWDGQDWDTAAWNKNWTPEVAIQKFFQARIFEKEYIKGNMPVLELGPTFYKISDLDRRRTLKLMTDSTGIFQQGYGLVTLVDWSTHDVVGTYTPKGMFLN